MMLERGIGDRRQHLLLLFMAAIMRLRSTLADRLDSGSLSSALSTIPRRERSIAVRPSVGENPWRRLFVRAGCLSEARDVPRTVGFRIPFATRSVLAVDPRRVHRVAWGQLR